MSACRYCPMLGQTHARNFNIDNPRRPCMATGCPNLVKFGRCEKHAKQKDRQSTSQRNNEYKWMYGRKWQKARAFYLRRHPVCAECAKYNRAVPATDVDHIEPHLGDRAKFWDQANWQALCRGCHSSKTATYDGGFGKPLVDKV